MGNLTQSDHDLMDRLIQFMFPKNATGCPDINLCCNLWFRKSTSTDSSIRDEYGGDVQAALDGHYDHWMKCSKGCLALMILVDQFPRHIFRDQDRMFSGTKKAKQIIADGLISSQELSPIQQLFVPCLILTHLEDLPSQKLCIDKFRELKELLPSEFHGFEVIFQKHHDVIKQFGRFPHRNDILGRLSSEEELQFMLDPENRFDLSARVDPITGTLRFGRSDLALWEMLSGHLRASKVIGKFPPGIKFSSPVITQGQEDKYRALFGHLDTDGNGRLEFENLKELFSRLKKPFSESKLSKFMENFSACRCCQNGLCFRQFVSIMEMDFGSDAIEPTVDEFFEVFSNHEDATQIDHDEFVACLQTMSKRFTLEEIESLYRKIDSDGKGFVTRKDFMDNVIKEFKPMYCRASNKILEVARQEPS